MFVTPELKRMFKEVEGEFANCEEGDDDRGLEAVKGLFASFANAAYWIAGNETAD